MKKTLIELGPFSIHLFGVFVALGVLVGLYVAQKEAKRKGLDADKIFNLVIASIIAAIVGGRIYYILVFNPGHYLNNLHEIFRISAGGLSIQGGLIGGILFGVVYSKYQQLSFWKVADTVAPAIILGQAVARVGCDVFGVVMEQPRFWGVMINNQVLHPAQIYESLLNYILFLGLWNYRDKTKYHGQLFIFYLIGFSFNRAIVEFFRTNPYVIGQFTVAHVTSIFIILVSVVIGFYLKDKSPMLEKNSISNLEKTKDNLIIIGLMILSVLTYYLIY